MYYTESTSNKLRPGLGMDQTPPRALRCGGAGYVAAQNASLAEAISQVLKGLEEKNVEQGSALGPCDGFIGKKRGLPKMGVSLIIQTSTIWVLKPMVTWGAPWYPQTPICEPSRHAGWIILMPFKALTLGILWGWNGAFGIPGYLWFSARSR